MKEIIVATKNKGKVKEFEAILGQLGYTITSLFDYPDIPDVEETGETFVDNALLKATTIANHLQKPVIADDSGLIVDALDGRPGVFSARYAGESKNDAENLMKVLTEMEGIPEKERTARFHCAIALAYPDGYTECFEGSCEGKITKEPEGVNGFGYDPIMYIEEKQKTMAQLTSEEKNEISHRAKALQQLKERW
ncbi:XTP/dITP diphosphatase [Alkalihalobacterium alkalinitrilicum]|uniref:XTP/dITP diphosphatase n=1 Tax=Alkalihalobacterium alkalinitrilicum TaxID=427920 RepID=UPI000994A746|nr:XTP/dITP diphosphatase [Alkalihalobacterium alkalinitrilicum]